VGRPRAASLVALGLVVALVVLSVGLAGPVQTSYASVVSANDNGSSNANKNNNDNGDNGNGNDNSDNGNGNDNDDNGNGNGNSNDNDDNGNGNDNSDTLSGAVTLSSSNPSVSNPDGTLRVGFVGGQPVRVGFAASEINSPAVPTGATVVRSWVLQLLPRGVPNVVTLTASNTSGAPAGSLQMFYFSNPLGRWVQLPVTTGPNGEATVQNLDVSAFSTPTQLALAQGPAPAPSGTGTSGSPGSTGAPGSTNSGSGSSTTGGSSDTSGGTGTGGTSGTGGGSGTQGP